MGTERLTGFRVRLATATPPTLHLSAGKPAMEACVVIVRVCVCDWLGNGMCLFCPEVLRDGVAEEGGGSQSVWLSQLEIPLYKLKACPLCNHPPPVFTAPPHPHRDYHHLRSIFLSPSSSSDTPLSSPAAASPAATRARSAATSASTSPRSILPVRVAW